MASSAAIAATTAAIKTLLDRAAAASPDFSTVVVTPFQALDMQAPPTSDTALVVSIYLHRVALSSVRTGMPAIVEIDGRRVRAPILLDLHYLVTAWARSALMQQKLLGWAIRTLDDTPVLPPTVLNDGGWAGVFGPTETVELVWQAMTTQEEMDVWQVAQTNEQPSASYLARGIALESDVPIDDWPPAQTIELDYAEAGS